MNYCRSVSGSLISVFHFMLYIFNGQSIWQIYVEIERSRLIKKLAKIKEEQGLIAEAADLMQEVAVSGWEFLVNWLLSLYVLWCISSMSSFSSFLSLPNSVQLQVETFGAMAKTEKIAFILEQVCSILHFPSTILAPFLEFRTLAHWKRQLNLQIM